MAIEIKQQLRLSQQLVMTPQLQQAIKLLQLSRMELADVIQEEMLQNPMLEDAGDGRQKEAGEVGAEGESEPTYGETEQTAPESRREEAVEVSADTQAISQIDWEHYLDDYQSQAQSQVFRGSGEELPAYETNLTKRTSLMDHLIWQLGMHGFSGEDERVASLIIGNLESDGYLRGETIEEIAADARVSIEKANEILARVQEFDPVGIAARSLEECLLIQARYIGADEDIVVAMISRHLGNLEKRNYPQIAKDVGHPIEAVLDAARIISGFNPKPGLLYSDDETQYITPDVYIHKIGDKYFVVPNDDGLPKLRLSSFYRSALSGNQEARQYVQDKLRSAQWLIRSIQQRQRTIVRVTESIIKFQREFFDKGVHHLKPLILRDVADDISMHESTISRVTTNKYVHTPQGLFELKYFFNSGISRTGGDEIASESVKMKIKEIVSGEDPKDPHSDQKLVDLLRGENIDIARRTVAKYREQLGILSSSKRRQVL